MQDNDWLANAIAAVVRVHTASSNSLSQSLSSLEKQNLLNVLEQEIYSNSLLLPLDVLLVGDIL